MWFQCMINASKSHSGALILIHYVKNKFLSLCAFKVFYLMAAGCDKVNITQQDFWLTFKKCTQLLQHEQKIIL